MDAELVDGVGRFHDALRETGVGVDDVAQLLGGHLLGDSKRQFRDDVGGMRAHDLRAEELVGLGIGDEPEEPFDLAHGQGFS